MGVFLVLRFDYSYNSPAELSFESLNPPQPDIHYQQNDGFPMVCLSKQHDFSSTERVQEKTPYSPKFRYQRDPIGNRITSTTIETGSPVIRNYTSNNLNQYTTISLEPNALNLSYNDDGCMLNDGTWTFTWDGENRMASATNGSQTLEFKYDYMGRRVEKRVLDGASETSKKRFVYDGYLQIEELNALDSNAILKKRIWEPGGNHLLSETALSPTPYTVYPLYDANKNITEYIDASGVIQAHFEYSPFGKITNASGLMPDAFDFRFSSEYFDQESGLVYYNFRYYSPELGRWMSRDPIGERGGINLYGMVGNDVISKFDKLGTWFNPFSTESYEMNPEGTVVESDEPACSTGPGTFVGGEIGGIIGAGFTQVECCDENNCWKRMLFTKYCIGAFAHVGGSAGVHNLKGKSCNKDAYKGWFLEFSAGPTEGDIGYTNSGAFSGTVEGGLSVNVGITTAGSVKWCYYIFDSEETLGCCGK